MKLFPLVLCGNAPLECLDSFFDTPGKLLLATEEQQKEGALQEVSTFDVSTHFLFLDVDL